MTFPLHLVITIKQSPSSIPQLHSYTVVAIFANIITKINTLSKPAIYHLGKLPTIKKEKNSQAYQQHNNPLLCQQLRPQCPGDAVAADASGPGFETRAVIVGMPNALAADLDRPCRAVWRMRRTVKTMMVW